MIRVRVEYYDDNETIIEYVDIHADRLSPQSAAAALKQVIGRSYPGYVYHNDVGYLLTKNAVKRIERGQSDKSGV